MFKSFHLVTDAECDGCKKRQRFEGDTCYVEGFEIVSSAQRYAVLCFGCLAQCEPLLKALGPEFRQRVAKLDRMPGGGS